MMHVYAEPHNKRRAESKRGKLITLKGKTRKRKTSTRKSSGGGTLLPFNR